MVPWNREWLQLCLVHVVPRSQSITPNTVMGKSIDVMSLLVHMNDYALLAIGVTALMTANRYCT